MNQLSTFNSMCFDSLVNIFSIMGITEANLKTLLLSGTVGRKKNNLFNNALNTFYLQIYGIGGNG